MAQLEILNLTKRFGPVTAVDDMTLDIADGEFFVLLGPNGAGKTTTLRCVAGLETPDEGQIKLDGEPMRGKSPAERNVAFVFQNYALYPRKTVFQNVAFPLEARRPVAEFRRVGRPAWTPFCVDLQNVRIAPLDPSLRLCGVGVLSDGHVFPRVVIDM